ncbi:4'-phosphopantetheinyl transferase superfamily protein [Umezawaea sp. Da 62-37]|uniref:4'-phosphopantetheinyl transferase family protein n=1 Tax=Umezawaea sp. Da 62-37 TaxID=3075927 RepID=UPI0028F7406C|nr:4'-phosphopantetheinyl transferase superfamily protein [Umezawaea sp. Da 62-37]WNV85133.1 4'-phosphopantetheinyl transferase superfamily protein [Umezawaea sp. Da 62-37]
MTDAEVLIVPVLPGRAPVHVLVSSAADTGTRYADAEEHAAAATMGPHRAEEFLRGRSLLRDLVAQVLGSAAASAPMRTTPRGKPVLGRGFDVSISHTGTHTAAAVWTDGGIGVDVADPPLPLDARLVRRCCGAHAEDVLARPDRAAVFSRVWAVQEACVKAIGMGLAAIPWRIPVHPDRRHGSWHRVRWNLPDVDFPCALALAVAPHPLEDR